MVDSQQTSSLSSKVSQHDDRTTQGIEPSTVRFALLETLGGHDFEDLVDNLLCKMGFHVEGRQRSADGGIDMIAVRQDPIVGGKFIIQCKRYSNAVGSSAVRDLYGVIHAESANKGVLITNSTFTKDARRFAESKPIELIDGAKLHELLVQHGLWVSDRSSAGKKLSPGIQGKRTLIAVFARVVAGPHSVIQRAADMLAERRPIISGF